MIRNALSEEVLWYLEDRGIPIPEPWQAPLVRTPEPVDVPGARFNPERVDKVLRVFHALRHTQGRLAGSPLDLDPWQVAYIIAPVFGWERQNEDGDWVRVITEVWIEVSRKNGKTTLSGGIAIYLTCADGEPGAQVVAAATTRDQAGFCFDPIAGLAENAPMLKKHVQSYRSSHKIIHRKSGSYFQAISGVAEVIHGANIHGAIIDEIHLHKSPDLVEAIETGVGSRRQPLIVHITTADDGKPMSIYARKRHRIEQLAERTISDPSVYGVIWAAALNERELTNPFSVEAQMAANPGFGVSPGRAYLAKKAAVAKDNPAELASYLRLHLGVRTKQVTRFITLDDWDASAGMIRGEDMIGRDCWAGVDLGSTSDLTAYALTFPDQETDTYRTAWRFWVPEAAMPSLSKRTGGEAEGWRKQGFLTVTPGNVIDNLVITQAILADAKRYRIKMVGHDPWHAHDVMRRLEDEGIETCNVGQKFSSLSGPLKEMERLVKQKRYIHGGNPIMRWMIDNLTVKIDPVGNVMPDKATSFEKIDGVTAAVVALSQAIAESNHSVVNDLWVEERFREEASER
jgi:phage terminase large subunit-like protein